MSAPTSASLIGHSGSSAFRLSTATVSTSLAGSCFSSESAPGGPSIMGFEDKVEQSFGRPYRQSDDRVQADMRSHLIHRPPKDIIPPLGGARLSSYRIWFCAVFMLLPRLVPGSTGTSLIGHSGSSAFRLL